MTEPNPPKKRVAPARRLLGAILALGAATLWLFPSDVAAIIAEQDHVILGRYSVDWFTILFLVTCLVAYASAILFFQTKFDRVELFRGITVTVAVIIGLVVVDVAGRSLRTKRYVEQTIELNPTHWPRDRVDSLVRHRPPDVTYTIDYVDRPAARRSYPDAGSGYPTSSITLTTDHRGFRNETELEAYDILTVGDSFVEGSRVSDDEMWPVLLGGDLDETVYNLGISGTSSYAYLWNYVVHGVERAPKTVIVMLYEGNDLREDAVFRSPDPEQLLRLKARLEKEGVTSMPPDLSPRAIFRSSPIVMALKRWMIAGLGPLNTDASFANSELVDWLPIGSGAASSAPKYVFKPKRLANLYWTEDAFGSTRGWESIANILRAMDQLCESEGSEFVITYAPTKVRVLLPLIRDRVPASRLRDFTALAEDDLPPADVFDAEVYDRIESKEAVVRAFCESEGITFVSPTAALREAMAAGQQVYYTYDQHWTRLGHVVVAGVLAEALR